ALDRVIATLEGQHSTAANPSLLRNIGVSWSAADGGKWAENAPDANRRLTSMVYDAAGNVVRRIAHYHDAPDQITQYVYNLAQATASGPAGLTALGNTSRSNGLLYEVRCPRTECATPGLPGSAEHDIVRYAYNLAGEQIAIKDQNGTVRQLVRDS